MLRKKLVSNNIYIEELNIKYSSKLFKIRRKKNLTKFLSPISNNPIDQKKFIMNDKRLGNYFLEFSITKKI